MMKVPAKREKALQRARMLSVVLSSTLLASCDGSPNPMGNGEEPPMMREIHLAPSFAEHIQEIFVRRDCTESGCHGIGQAGLTLTSDIAANYANLVNVAAKTERSFLRVKPFDATNSYLVIKLEGRNLLGSRMPIGPPLDIIDLTNIKNWIDNGAANN